jgi:hypothetical protein
MTYHWASDKITVPAGIANWFEAWVAVCQVHPDPSQPKARIFDTTPPEDWHD